MRIGLIGCVKQKASCAAPARVLYTSALFRGRRGCVEQSCDRWFILSALHGLVDPDAVIAPYDATLKDVGRARRREWTGRVLQQIDEVLGEVAGVTFEIHAGNHYCGDGLLSGLVARGAQVDRRMVGLSLGQQLERYASGACESGSVVGRPLPVRTADMPPSGAGRPQSILRGQEGRGSVSRPASKYAPLFDYLQQATGREVSLTFAQVEAILGFRLPASARNHQAWWGSDPKHSHATSWLHAGFSASPNLTGETVTFRPR